MLRQERAIGLGGACAIAGLLQRDGARNAWRRGAAVDLAASEAIQGAKKQDQRERTSHDPPV